MEDQQPSMKGIINSNVFDPVRIVFATNRPLATAEDLFNLSKYQKPHVFLGLNICPSYRVWRSNCKDNCNSSVNIDVCSTDLQTLYSPSLNDGKCGYNTFCESGEILAPVQTFETITIIQIINRNTTTVEFMKNFSETRPFFVRSALFVIMRATLSFRAISVNPVQWQNFELANLRKPHQTRCSNRERVDPVTRGVVPKLSVGPSISVAGPSKYVRRTPANDAK